MNTLTIIILSFNTKDETLRAVQSCFDLTYEDIHVVVVDNNSSDGSVDALKKMAAKEKRLDVIALSTNSGFAAGNNVALSKVKTTYVMLLNSDAYFPENSNLSTLVDYMDIREDVGVVTPKVVLGSGKLDPASHRGFPTPWNALSYYSKLEKMTAKIPLLNQLFGGYHQTWKDIETIHDIDACSGAAMLVRSKAMKQVGVFDEQFFMYGEDIDWCYRFKEKGWAVVYHPEVTVIHDKHTSGLKKTHHHGKNDATVAIQTKSTHAFFDAMKLFYKKHYSQRYAGWFQSLVFAGIDSIRRLK